ncbi:MAG: EAL domain-containing protein [Bacillota bacterium]
MKESEIQIIRQVIENESIEVHLQPIISIKKKTVVGLEALSRGIVNMKTVPPSELFSIASASGYTVALDRLCRKKSLELYSYLKKRLSDDIILFLNFDASIIDQGVVGSGVLLETAKSLGINPSSIAIELNETCVEDLESLKKFINTHRDYGFIIALDDIGAGHSNLNRVAITRPDILKIDRTLVKDLDREIYKQEVFKSLINLARNIGSLVVAEGIEREEEAIAALDFGVDMLQGFYFSRPERISVLSLENLKGNIETTAYGFKQHSLQKLKIKHRQNLEYNSIVGEFINRLEDLDHNSFNSCLKEMIGKYKYIECIYIIDEFGIQVSETICNHWMISYRKRPAFRPAPPGTDHSLKDYYYLLAGSGIPKYVTDPYISMASGNLCTTISTVFENALGNSYIFCLDINTSL